MALQAIKIMKTIITTATSFIMIAIFIDINECTEGISGCSDGCENTPGYFECSCPSGFTLSHQDNKTCIGKRKKPFINSFQCSSILSFCFS